MKNLRDFLTRSPFGNKLENLALPGRESVRELAFR
jgi:hypothetical protein